MKYRADIDGLRTVAVLPVVLFHAGLGFSGGYVGVDVFFVISGYLITSIISAEMLKRTFSLAGFYERRIRRLFPALFAVLATSSLFAYLLLIPQDQESFAHSLLATLGFGSNIYFYIWGAGYFVEQASLQPLLHTWSLAVEEQFYVVFPVILLVMINRVPYWLVRGLVGLGIIASFLLCLRWSQSGEAAFYLPHPRVWELGIGAFLALIPGLTQRIFARGAFAECAVAAGLGAIIWSMLTYTEGDTFPGWRAAIPCLGAALVIAAGQGRVTWGGQLLSTPPFVFIGKLSYALYLWHWPVIVFMAYGSFEPLGLAQGCLAVALSITLAALTWHYIERPFRTRKIGTTRVKIFSIGAAGSAALLCVAGAFVFSDGDAGRFPEDLQQKLAINPHPRNECHLLSLAEMRNGDYCQRGEIQAEPSFILAGDSHAKSIADTVFNAAGALGRSGWQITGPGFLPLAVGWDVWRGQSLKVSAFERFLDNHPEVDLILITGYWLNRAVGTTYRHNGMVLVDDQYDGSGTRYNPTALENGLRHLARSFPDRQFVLLDDVPTGRALHAPDVVRAAYVGKAGAQAGLSRVEAEHQYAAYGPILAHVADTEPNMAYRPLFTEYLCDETACPLFSADGRKRFQDGDHLSPHGAGLFYGAFHTILGTY